MQFQNPNDVENFPKMHYLHHCSNIPIDASVEVSSHIKSCTPTLSSTQKHNHTRMHTHKRTERKNKQHKFV